MQTNTLRTIGASVILAGVVIAAIAQAGNGHPETAEIIAADSAAVTKETSQAVATKPTTAPEEAFVYRVGVLSGITTDNFWAFYGEEPSVWNAYILGPTKPALFTFDASLSTLRPELAMSRAEPVLDHGRWQLGVDLNPNLAWSDGTPVTAHDLVFTFETVRELGLGGSWAGAFPETIQSIHAKDDHHVHFEFTERPRLSVWPHGVGLAPIMARHVWDSEIQDITADALYEMSGGIDVGGGPLTVAAVSDSLIVSHSNDGYPLQSLPDTVEYHVYGDEATLVSALSEGGIDSVLTPLGIAGESLTAIESKPGIELVNNPGNGIRYLGFNLERDPMADRAFRQALAFLLDRETLAETIPQAGRVAWSLVPEANTQWYDAEAGAENARRYEGSLTNRLNAALEGLADAGYTWETAPSIDDGDLIPGKGLAIDGRPPQILTILTSGDAYDPARPDYVAEIAATLGVLGFDARPVETDFDSVVDLVFTRNGGEQLHYDMFLLGWTLGNPALPGYYRTLFAPGGSMNNTGYESKAFNNALQSYEGAYTTETALDALWDMEHTLAIDLPYLPLYTTEITEAYRSDRVSLDIERSLGGLQARLGGIGDVRPND